MSAQSSQLQLGHKGPALWLPDKAVNSAERTLTHNGKSILAADSVDGPCILRSSRMLGQIGTESLQAAWEPTFRKFRCLLLRQLGQVLYWQ